MHGGVAVVSPLVVRDDPQLAAVSLSLLVPPGLGVRGRPTGGYRLASLHCFGMSSRIKLAAALVVVAGICAAGAFGAYLLLKGSDDSTAKPPRPADGKYSNARVRYSFDYPQDWQDLTDTIQSKLPENAAVLDQVTVGTIDKDTQIFRGATLTVVKVNHVIDSKSLDSELTALDDTFQKQAVAVKGKLDPPQPAKLGGLDARQYNFKFAFTSTQVVFDVASSQVTTFFGDRQYTVNCQGPTVDFNKTVLEGCEQVLQSFRFQ